MMNRLASLILATLLVLAGSFAALAQDSSTEVPLAPDMAMGDPDAPVTVIEYGSYTCPHCARFNEEVFPLLKADYIDTGKVRFIHREIYFDRYGLWAALLARCGDGTRYFGMNDLIYGTQRDWLGNGEPQEVLNNLRKMGRLAGLEDEQIDACLKDKDTAQSLVATFQHYSTADDVRGTPTFIIDGQKYSNMPYSDFREAIDSRLPEEASE